MKTLFEGGEKIKMDVFTRFKKAWNVFKGTENNTFQYLGPSSYSRYDRIRLRGGNERSIVTSVFNKIALDCSSVKIRHVKLDPDGNFLSEQKSGLNECLSTEANIDQSSANFIRDIVMSMFDEGCVAVVPTDTSESILNSTSYDIYTLRVGKVTQWFPYHVTVEIYDERNGRKKEVILPKRAVAIIENPLYAVTNEPNSTVQRLIKKLNLLDVIDEQNGSGKLDLIIQLPYIIKTEARREQAEVRRKDIESQLSGSKYGIAYTDGTERITQLNRPVENNLMGQIEYLTSMLYSQLGITQGVLDGTADDTVMENYYGRAIDPILSAIADEFRRKFLTKTARTQGQDIQYFRDAFKLISPTKIAEMADTLRRNEIMTSNEIRQKIGMKPSTNEKADDISNPNINQPKETDDSENGMQDMYDNALRDLDTLDAQLDDMEKFVASDSYSPELSHYASPYYDPVKAHEYYEEHKKLKGRRSTAGLNDKGKEAARYVKEQLTTERKKKVDEHKQYTDSSIETVRNETTSEIEKNREETQLQIDSYKTQMQSKIDRLSETLKSMSKEERAIKSDSIKAMIADLREDNKAQRESLMTDYKSFRDQSRAEQKTEVSGYREDHKIEKERLKTEYDSKYEAELEKIKGSSEFQKTTKKKRR